jgi:hypothetical protein
VFYEGSRIREAHLQQVPRSTTAPEALRPLLQPPPQATAGMNKEIFDL